VEKNLRTDILEISLPFEEKEVLSPYTEFLKIDAGVELIEIVRGQKESE